ncbi:MAG: hypothetical protein M3Z04_09625 [Chloroflexota bacterium]|nr:hypothetical protein [Chloroflexota bacterium]
MDLTTADRRLFDVYLAVDWSARSLPSPARPSADALWVGEALAAAPHESQESYWRTRAACVAHVRARLLTHVAAGRRVLIGCDFPYGYPAGTAAALAGGTALSGDTAPSYAGGAAALSGDTAPSYADGAAWRWMWGWLAARIMDDAANGNNRFAVAAAANACAGGSPPGPFWGCPPAQAGPHLTPTSPSYPYATAGPTLARLRTVEQRLRGTQPCWKLLGTGSVGGQALLGIPRVAAWRADPALAAVSRIWPFETGFTASPTSGPGPAVIHAEIWPGIVPDALDPTMPIRDQAQVRAVVRWLAARDMAGTLGDLFAPPPDLSPDLRAACLAEEGWLLGA